jgi:hypothetical protein
MATIFIAVSRSCLNIAHVCRLGDELNHSAEVALKRWSYGKTLEVTWGDVRLVPSEEKWHILFEVVD